MSEKKSTAAERVRAKRLANRKNKIQNIKKGSWAPKVGGLVLFSAILYFLIFSASVNDITIKGVKNTPQTAVNGSIKGVKGSSLFRAPVSAIEKKLMDSGWPESVRIDRQYWSRKIVIEVEERKPFVNVQLNKGYLIIDKNLFVIENRKVYALDIPVIQETGIKTAKSGENLKGDKIEAASSILSATDPSVLKLITFLSVGDLNDIRIWTEDTTVIVYGEAVEIEKKNVAIRSLIKEHGADLITIDVRVPSKPAIKLKTAKS